MGEQVVQTQKAAGVHYLLIIMIGLVVGVIAELPTTVRVSLAAIVGIIYTFFVVRGRFKLFTLSRRTRNVMIAIFVIAIILVGAVTVTSSFRLTNGVFLIVWLVLVVVSLGVTGSLPASSVVLKSILTGAALVSLGAAVGMVGAPVVDYATHSPVQVTIYNNCNTPLGYSPLGIYVPAHDSRTVEVPRGTVTVRSEAGQIYAEVYGLELRYPLPENVDVLVDGQLINRVHNLEINLKEGEIHQLVITCR
jgi:hypothetical protein